MVENELRDLVSIIVPVYKVEAYLKYCVESIRNQTYENLEIILVDDGSPDECPKICDDFAKIDSRIKVIHQKNGGLSAARNVGIETASGEYVVFVDSDDKIHSRFVELMYNVIKSESADIAICNMKKIYTIEYVEESLEQDVEKYLCFDGKRACEKMYEGGTETFVTACAKMYKRMILNTVGFPMGKIHEDNFTTYRYFLSSNKVVHIPTEMYFYFTREGSIMNSSLTEKNFDRYEAFEEQIKCFEQLGMTKAKKMLLQNYIYLLNIDVNKTERYKLKREIKKCRKDVLKKAKESNLFTYNELKNLYAPTYNEKANKIYWLKEVFFSKMRKKYSR